jgi:Mg-chelatase subunit ChlD
MNYDEKNSETKGKISADLEARIVAWISGEAPAAEAAELERLTAEHPGVAAFKKHIEATRNLVKEAVSPDPVPLRLSEARRGELLRALGRQETSAGDVVASLAALRRRQRIEHQWLLAAAACLVLGLFVSAMFIPSFQKVYSASAQKRAPYAMGREVKQEKLEREAREERSESATFAKEGRDREVVIQMPAIGQDLASEASTVADDQPVPEQPGARYYGARRMEYTALGAQPTLSAVGGGKKALDESIRQASAGYVEHFAGTAGTASAGQAAVVAGSPTIGEAASLSPAPLNAPESRSEAPMVLSPFVVNSPEDKGSYQANSTLAGTRVRTDLKDASSAITVVAAQFLQDTGAKNDQDLLTYAPKTDVAGLAGQLSGAAGAIGEIQPSAVSAAAAPAGASLQEETSASKEPVSTFSLHVSDVSFRLAQEALARGELPDPAGIRPEEFYNAFSYGDPEPSMAEKISCRTEQSADPVMQQRNLVRIAMRVPATGRSAAQPLRLTVLLDTSGSMEREDRAAAVRSAMKVLVSLLGPADRVTLIGFARRPRLLAEQLPGDQAARLLDIIAHTPAEGGTNLEEAIKLGHELALRQYLAQAQNRVVLLTDGAANLGDADPAHLAAIAEAMRQQDIAFDACGVGTDGIDDSVLEALTRKGSGRYYVVDTPESADAGFARQLAGAFHPAAENVKVQVRFNPARVGAYRLIGFEHHRLSKEDFRNDRVAAAALAAGEAAVALYDVEVLPQGDGELGEVYVRFRDTAAGAMVERSWTLAYDAHAPAFDRASPSMQLAGTAALLAEKLQGGPRAGAIHLAQLAPVVNALRGRYAHEARVQELAAMYEQMRRIRPE